MRENAGTRSDVTRRRLLELGMTGLAAALAACALGSSNAGAADTSDGGRLRARPKRRARADDAAPAGTQPLGLAMGRDGLVYVPTGYRAGQPAPLVVMLHGAGGAARGGLHPLQSLADEAGLILLAPDSRAGTWDAIHDGFAADVAFIDLALLQTFDRYDVDPSRIAVAGFSDGASYALSLGLANGDLFARVIAFSPGFMVPATRRGKPRIFVSHGTRDQVLPIDRCSRRIVPELRDAGYEVRYREFNGPHTVPPDIAREATDWLVPTGR